MRMRERHVPIPNFIFGTNFADVLRGLSGDDLLDGGEGDDRLFGRDGDDRLFGDGGADRLIGGNGDDFLFGGSGDDVLRGGRGDDDLRGGDGVDDLRGGGGDDALDGGDGADILFGGGGRDFMQGGAGADVLSGGGGADVLIGGLGQDTITTGRGRDTVSFRENALSRIDPDPDSRQVVGGEDFVTDFTQGRDMFEFDAEAFDVFGPLSFVNALAEDLPASGANVIVLQNSDDDGDPRTVFNAGSAANLIAEQVTEDGAGFFAYFNSALGVNRLVYSDNLADASADLQIVARLTDVEGQDAIDALAGFTARDFAFRNEQAPLDDQVGDGDVILATEGADVFVFEGEFNAGGFVDADADVRFFPDDRPEIIGFDAAEDVIKLDGRPVGDGVDALVEEGAGRNLFLFEDAPLGDSQALASVVSNRDGATDEGFFVYYEARDDVVKVASFENVQFDGRFADNVQAGVIAEIDVDGREDGLALIADLSLENFDLF